MHQEKKALIYSVMIPALLILPLWIIHGIQFWGGVELHWLGIKPLSTEGLLGILTSPLIHGDWDHLLSNTVPLFVMGAGLIYYYPKVALRIFILMYLITNIWVWVFARGNAYHIGASGLVYGLASFHFISGLIRRIPRLMAFTMLVVFLYGSMVWGVIPDFHPTKNISWESHLMGGIAGFILAIYYRNEGPQRKKYDWELEEELEMQDEEEDEDRDNLDGDEQKSDSATHNTSSQQQPVKIRYLYKRGRK
ncbi:MAG: rhomboid family intramembrane serine protease [Bacteroidales bacterium]|nr:rhomboid family intramembrane serine protease [Bacteroidales bacterium]